MPRLLKIEIIWFIATLIIAAISYNAEEGHYKGLLAYVILVASLLLNIIFVAIYLAVKWKRRNRT